LKSQDVYPELPEAARRASTTTGIWHLLFNGDVKVTEVWFSRELSVDEYYRKVRLRSQLCPGWQYMLQSPRPHTAAVHRLQLPLPRCANVDAVQPIDSS
jgi:hypothetical protein